MIFFFFFFFFLFLPIPIFFPFSPLVLSFFRITFVISIVLFPLFFSSGLCGKNAKGKKLHNSKNKMIRSFFFY
jgi:hypothetical protein